MIEDCSIAKEVVIYHPDLCNIYGCSIGAFSTVGPFVEIQRGVTIGKFTKISSHTFICDGVEIGDRVFVGHGVMFTNDLYPSITAPFVKLPTIVENDVAIGSGATILPVRIGQGATVGAGSVVTKDVPSYSIVAGNPARVIRQFADIDEKRAYIEKECNHLRSLSQQSSHHTPFHRADEDAGLSLRTVTDYNSRG
jgi:UDP-2-acetamido-3-amino-2,3-dideoxy-glucuronate N-acetyltransferase